MYQVDAFTDKVFEGNPAAVCILKTALEAQVMQQIAAENNLAETAFVLPNKDGFEIRWFTPTVEVELCGHATLAAAHVLYEYYQYEREEIRFTSLYSGLLTVSKEGKQLTLNFPKDDLHEIDKPVWVEKAFEIQPSAFYKGKTDVMLVFDHEQDIINQQPDLSLLATSEGRGVIITAPGTKSDFVSRFFAPQSGIDEDPVTGSAHTSLTPYWSNRLGKSLLTARQLSKRMGKLLCEDLGDRVAISGKAVTFMKASINI